MNLHYPAASADSLTVVCEKLAAGFALPPFAVTRESEHVRSARSASGPFAIEVVEFLGHVSAEDAAKIDSPDQWNLAWRAEVGLEFNFQVSITRGTVTRRQRERTARKLRLAFSEIRLHGD